MGRGSARGLKHTEAEWRAMWIRERPQLCLRDPCEGPSKQSHNSLNTNLVNHYAVHLQVLTETLDTTEFSFAFVVPGYVIRSDIDVTHKDANNLYFSFLLPKTLEKSLVLLKNCFSRFLACTYRMESKAHRVRAGQRYEGWPSP